jgi:hypothetical protein
MNYAQIKNDLATLLGTLGPANLAFTQDQVDAAVQWAQEQAARLVGLTYTEPNLPTIDVTGPWGEAMKGVTIPMDAIKVLRCEIGVYVPPPYLGGGGYFITTLTPGGGYSGVAVDAAGNVYLGENNSGDVYNTLWRRDRLGGMANVLADKTSQIQSISGGDTKFNDVCIDAGGNLFFIDWQYVWKLDPSGVLTTVADVGDYSGGNGESDAKSITIDPETGDLFVYRYRSGNHRDILKVTQAGVISPLVTDITLLDATFYQSGGMIQVGSDRLLYYLLTASAEGGDCASTLESFDLTTGTLVATVDLGQNALALNFALQPDGSFWAQNDRSSSPTYGLNQQAADGTVQDTFQKITVWNTATTPVDGYAAGTGRSSGLNSIKFGMATVGGATYLIEQWANENKEWARKIESIPAFHFRIDTLALANTPDEKTAPYNFAGLAMDLDENFYTGDTSNGYIVWKVTPAGVISNIAGDPNTNPLSYVMDICTNGSAVFFVDWHYLWRIDFNNLGKDVQVADINGYAGGAGVSTPAVNVAIDPISGDLFVARWASATRQDILRVTQAGAISVFCSSLSVLVGGDAPNQSLRVVNGVLYYVATDGAGTSRIVAFDLATKAVLYQHPFPNASFNNAMAFVPGVGGWSTDANPASADYGLNFYDASLAVIPDTAGVLPRFAIGTSPVDGLTGTGKASASLVSLLQGPDGNTHLIENYDPTFATDFVIRTITRVPSGSPS